MASPEPDKSRKGEIQNIKVTIDGSTIRTRLISTVKQQMEAVELEDAEVIVAGGGGIGGVEGFNLLRDLAKIWGGAIGTTRVPCDEGWVPSTSFEIGLTGKTVRPKLYFAVGISGASQHIVGCTESKVIVAINKDPQASIFRVSDFGIVGDYRLILPALIKELMS
jgi:electron transfer flavoprotein alpha subunit